MGALGSCKFAITYFCPSLRHEYESERGTQAFTLLTFIYPARELAGSLLQSYS